MPEGWYRPAGGAAQPAASAGRRRPASSQPATPTANIAHAGEHGLDRQRHHQQQAAQEPGDVEEPGPAPLCTGLGEGCGVGNGVVDEDAKGGEADGAAQVGGQHQHADRHAQRQLRMVRHAVARDGPRPASAAGRALRAMASAVRPTPAIRASSAPSAATAAPACTTGSAQRRAHGLHRRRRAGRERRARRRPAAASARPHREVDHDA